MLDGTFDLAIIEGYSYNPHGGSVCGKECFLSRLKYAKAAGGLCGGGPWYINRTIVMYGYTCPKSQKFSGGFTVDSMCALVSATRSQYPEMPGAAFYGCGFVDPSGPGGRTHAEQPAALLRGINDCVARMYAGYARGSVGGAAAAACGGGGGNAAAAAHGGGDADAAASDGAVAGGAAGQEREHDDVQLAE
eukprot:gene10419-9961_t